MLHTHEKYKLEEAQANFWADVFRPIKKAIAGVLIFGITFTFTVSALTSCADDVDRVEVVK